MKARSFWWRNGQHAVQRNLLISDHLLLPARQLHSPNQSARPDGSRIDLIVVHNISLPPGVYGGGFVDDLFLNRLQPDQHPYFTEVAGLKVSAHLLIDREGQITQYVPFDRKAWHAGASCFAGQDNCNDYSIGIELEGTDSECFTAAQYSRLSEVINVLLIEYPNISTDRIVGHSDVAPGRKTDPGPCFDWERLRSAWLS